MAVQEQTRTISLEDKVRITYTGLPNFKRQRLPLPEIRKLNRRLRVAYAAIGEDREAFLKRSVDMVADKVQPQMNKVIASIRKNAIEQIVQHAVQMYQSAHKTGEPDGMAREQIRRQLRGATHHADTLNRILREAVAESGASYVEAVEIFHAMQALLHWRAAKLFYSAVMDRKGFLTRYYVQKYVPKSFTAEDWMLVNIIMGSQFPELAKPIAARQNLITVPGFSDSIFDTVRGSFREKLYERLGGGLGAEAMARSLADDLVGTHGGNLPVFPKEKYMLWARTEGAVIQNDALKMLGERAKMDGKIWQSCGDEKVRNGKTGPGDHVANEADGVISTAATFADSSLDAGSGSISPYNCRCVSGPALLEDSRPGGKGDLPLESEPEKPAVPVVPKPTKPTRSAKPKSVTDLIGKETKHPLTWDELAGTAEYEAARKAYKTSTSLGDLERVARQRLGAGRSGGWETGLNLSFGASADLSVMQDVCIELEMLKTAYPEVFARVRKIKAYRFFGKETTTVYAKASSAGTLEFNTYFYGNPPLFRMSAQNCYRTNWNCMAYGAGKTTPWQDITAHEFGHLVDYTCTGLMKSDIQKVNVLDVGQIKPLALSKNPSLTHVYNKWNAQAWKKTSACSRGAKEDKWWISDYGSKENKAREAAAEAFSQNWFGVSDGRYYNEQQMEMLKFIRNVLDARYIGPKTSGTSGTVLTAQEMEQRLHDIVDAVISQAKEAGQW